MMELGVWLAKKKMNVTTFAMALKISRQVVWKVKNGIPIQESSAKKIQFATGGCVNPVFRNRGRQKKI